MCKLLEKLRRWTYENIRGNARDAESFPTWTQMRRRKLTAVKPLVLYRRDLETTPTAKLRTNQRARGGRTRMRTLSARARTKTQTTESRQRWNVHGLLYIYGSNHGTTSRNTRFVTGYSRSCLIKRRLASFPGSISCYSCLTSGTRLHSVGTNKTATGGWFGLIYTLKRTFYNLLK